MSNENIREEVLFFSQATRFPVDESNIPTITMEQAQKNLVTISEWGDVTDEEVWFLIDHVHNNFGGYWIEYGLQIVSSAPNYPFEDDILLLSSLNNAAITTLRSYLLSTYGLEIEVSNSPNLKNGLISEDVKGFLTAVDNPQSLSDGEVELLLLVYREVIYQNKYKQPFLISPQDMLAIDIELKRILESNGYAAYNVFNLEHTADREFTDVFDRLQITYSYVGARSIPPFTVKQQERNSPLVKKIKTFLNSLKPTDRLDSQF